VGQVTELPKLTPLKNKAVCFFSVDVEDWFHILDVASSPAISQWDDLPSRVERNFLTLLDLFEGHNISATCFFLGWVAHKYPHLVREAQRRGHEVASHGFSHRLTYNMSPREFCDDALHSKKILEDLIGHEIRGYRAAGFSVTQQVPWFFDKLIEAGYLYDSSVFPAPRGHGGLQNGRFAPYVIDTSSGRIVEFPVTVVPVLGRPMCFFGGGYLRLFPLSLIRKMTRRVLAEGRPVVFYVHPREIDVLHPRLAMSLTRRFKSYVCLAGTRAKIEALLQAGAFTTFEDYLSVQGTELGTVGEAPDRFAARP